MIATNKVHIENIITQTFNVIAEVYQTNSEKQLGGFSAQKSRILFPMKRDKQTRISEQELRFVFIEQFNQYVHNHPEWNVYYSVETPTENGYSGFDTINPKCEGRNGGRSGCVDMCIHNSVGERICMIEFKANNQGEPTYTKDFCKLTNEKVELAYFLQIIENDNSGTVPNIIEKTKASKGDSIHYCYCLRKKDYVIKTTK